MSLTMFVTAAPDETSAPKAAALTAARADGFGDRLGLLPTRAIVHGDRRPGFSQRQRDRLANAARGAGDQSHPVLQFRHAGFPLDDNSGGANVPRSRPGG